MGIVKIVINKSEMVKLTNIIFVVRDLMHFFDKKTLQTIKLPKSETIIISE
jgi:hypothetical protein